MTTVEATPTSPSGKRKREETHEKEKIQKVDASSVPDEKQHSNLTKEQLASFQRDGLLILKADDVWTKDEKKNIDRTSERDG